MSNEQILLSTGDISKRLGLNISAPFIREVLNVEHTEKIKAGFYWNEAGEKAIYLALAHHIKRVHDGEHAPVREVTPRKQKVDEAADDPLFADESTFDPLFAD